MLAKLSMVGTPRRVGQLKTIFAICNLYFRVFEIVIRIENTIKK